MPIRWRLPLVLALTTLVLAGIVALVSAVVLHGVLLDRLEDDMARQVRQYAAALEAAATDGGPAASEEAASADTESLQSLTVKMGAAGEARFTVIDSNGRVLADSEVDPTTLDNHADRPEVNQALHGNEGRARRDSATLDQGLVYVAIPLPASAAAWSEGALRIALPTGRVGSMVAASWRVPLILWAILLVPTLAVAYFLTRSITRPIGRLRQMTARVAAGDLGYRTSMRSGDELGDLADSLNSMAAQLENRAGQLGAEMERSGRVLAAMSEGVLLIDAEGRLLRSNPAAEEMLETRLEEHEGTPLVLTLRSFPAQAYAHKAHAAGKVTTEILDLPGGRSLTVEVVPLSRSPGDQSGHTLFVVRDETARRITERMRRDFATNVSHELKTPLAGLSLLADTLSHAVREDPEQAQLFMTRLSAEIGRLTELVRDLLTLSRLEDPEMAEKTTFEPTDLARVASEAADELTGLADAKHHDLTVDLPEVLPVTGDDVALRTLVRNLLENALRYTEPGGHVALQGRLEEDGEGGPWAVLAVIDDGVGIPLADQQRIFERFYRVDKARSRETGGTGLGLSIVRHVAERHGGRVEVQSTVGVGSTFTVYLPATP